MIDCLPRFVRIRSTLAVCLAIGSILIAPSIDAEIGTDDRPIYCPDIKRVLATEDSALKTVL